LNERPLVHSAVRRWRLAATTILVTGVFLGIAISSSSATTRSHSAVGPLAQEWIRTLTPASTGLPKTIAALKKLPHTASVAQVDKVVAPVAGLLTPVENVLPHTTATSLEGLGTPVIGPPPYAFACSGDYKSAGQGARLVMAGVTYRQGFQADPVTGDCTTWSWHIGTRFKVFSAFVGLDTTRSISTVLAFLNNGKPMEFSADGRPVTSDELLPGVPTSIILPTAGLTNFVIQLTSAGAPVVDFANDSLLP
jgi:hypothetical protein